MCDDGSYLRFKQWLIENGVSLNCVDICNYEGQGRGIILTKDIQSGEIPICIPKKLILSSETIKSQFAQLQKSESWIALCLGILFEKHLQDSFWKYYIDLLPKEFSVPFYYSKDEIKLLKNCVWSSRKRKQHKKSIDTLKSTMKRMNHPDFNFSKKELEWSYFIWITRSWKTSAGHEIFLPLMDLLNHSDSATKVICDLRESRILQVERPMKKGEQLVVNYGKRNMTTLLEYYGFVPVRQYTGVEDILGEECFEFCLKKVGINSWKFQQLIGGCEDSLGEVTLLKLQSQIENLFKELIDEWEDHSTRRRFLPKKSPNSENLLNIFRLRSQEAKILQCATDVISKHVFTAADQNRSSQQKRRKLPSIEETQSKKKKVQLFSS